MSATLAESERHRVRAEEAETQGNYKLWEADLDHAQARRMSRKSGQRFAALRSIQEALQLPTPPGRSIDELRTEAIAALCLPDIEVEKEWDGWPAGSACLAFDPEFERDGRGDRAGKISVRRVSDDAALFELPPPPGGDRVDEYGGVEFSPDGRYLHQRCFQGGSIRAPVASGRPRAGACAGRQPFDRPVSARRGSVRRQLPRRSDSPIRRRLVPRAAKIRDQLPTNGHVHRHDLEAEGGEHCFLRTRRTAEPRPGDGSCSTVTRPIPCDIGGFSWSPDGRVLALTGSDHKIYVWDAASNRCTSPPLSGHIGGGGDIVRFSPSGERLLSTDWAGLWILWDARTGRRLLTVPARFNVKQFSGDGRRLASPEGEKLRLFRYAEGTEFRGFCGLSKVGPGIRGQEVTLDPAGRLAAVHTASGIALIDLVREERVGLIPQSSSRVAGFQADGALLTNCLGGLVRWPVAVDAATGRRTLGPPQLLHRISGDASNCSASTDGRVVAVADNSQSRGGSLLLHPSRRDARTLGPQQDARNCAVSPDGRWVATGSFNLDKGNGVKIWDGQTGQYIRDLPIAAGSEVRFSPDSRWLLTTGPMRASGRWMEGKRTGSARGTDEPDGGVQRRRALARSRRRTGVVRLLDPATGRELARLTAPEDSHLIPTAFTPDGARLIVFSGESTGLYLFDLRAIRTELAALGSDWDAPPFPPTGEVAKIGPPPAIDVDVGDLPKQIQVETLVDQAFKDWQQKNHTSAAKTLRQALTIAPDLACQQQSCLGSARRPP